MGILNSRPNIPIAVNTVANKQINKSSQPQIICEINGIKIRGILDTGSYNSIMSTTIAQYLDLKIEKRKKIDINLQEVTGTSLKIAGLVETPIIISNRKFNVTFIVIENINKETLLLGLQFLKSSNLTLNFAKNVLIEEIPPNQNNINTPTKLRSKIYIDGEYSVEPLSNAIVFAKIFENNDVDNELPCVNLQLHLQQKLDTTMVYSVHNTTNKTVYLHDNDLLGIAYTTNKQTINAVNEPVNAMERAKTV